MVKKGRFPKSAVPAGDEIPKREYKAPEVDFETESRRELLIEDILAVTHDPKSKRFYEIIVSRLPEHAIRKFVSEIKSEQLEGGELRNAGAVFTTKVKQWCLDNGEPEFWKKRAGQGTAA